MRVSVAMATYNGAKYLRRQLDSILDNLSGEDEIVISDDGSTDETLEILAQYQEKDNRIRLLDGPHKGVISNFEYAIEACEGDYIFLSDQDDIWLPNKVDEVMKAFTTEDVYLVIHDAKVVGEDLRDTIMDSFFAYRGSRPGVWANLVKNRYMGCCMAFKKELVPLVVPIPKDIPMHDQWIGMVSDRIFGKSCFLSEKLLLYRRHENAVSDFEHNSVGVMIKNRWMIYHHLKNRIREIRKERKL